MAIYERARNKVSGEGRVSVLFLLVVVMIGLGSLNQASGDEESRWLFKKGPAYIEDWGDSELSQPTYDDSDLILSPSFEKDIEIRRVLVNGREFKEYEPIRINEGLHCKMSVRIDKGVEILYEYK